MKVDLREVEEACKELYIRALKRLPPDIKEGFKRFLAAFPVLSVFRPF